MGENIDIFEIAKYAIKVAEKNYSNYKCAEVFIGKSEYLNIEIEENSVKNSEIGRDHGISIRIYQKMGPLGSRLQTYWINML